MVGDLEDAELMADEYDVIIGNFTVKPWPIGWARDWC